MHAESKSPISFARKLGTSGAFTLLCLLAASANAQRQAPATPTSQGISGVIVDANLRPILSPGTISIRKPPPPEKPMAVTDDVVTFGPTEAYLPASNKALQRPYANESYRIDGLAPGDYEVGMQVPDGYKVFYSTGPAAVAYTALNFKPYGPINTTPVVVTVHLAAGEHLQVNWKFAGAPRGAVRDQLAAGDRPDPDDNSPDDQAQVSQRLTCNIDGTNGPLAATDVATLDGGSSVWSTIGVNRDIGGIGVNWTLINHADGDASVQIIDAASAGGAAWQSVVSLIDAKQVTASGTKYPIDHYNQAAGNSAENWGFGSPFKAGKFAGLRQLQYTPLYSNDHLATVGSSTIAGDQLLQSPCYHTGKRFGEGRIHLRPTYSAVTTAAGQENVLTINSTYDFRAMEDQTWASDGEVSFDEQALYLLRSAAFANDLRIYVHAPGRPVAGPVKPADFFDGSALPKALVTAHSCTPSNPLDACFIETVPLDYAVLVWRVGKSDVAIAVHGENIADGKHSTTFTGTINLRAALAKCIEQKDHACGNVQWHTIFDLPVNANGMGVLNDGHRIRQKIHYDMGTVAAIGQMGYPIR